MAGSPAAQRPLPLDPLEPRTMPTSGWPWWTLNVRRSGHLDQTPHRLSDMEWILRNLRPGLDTYMSQSLFSAPNRRALNVLWMTHAYVDLDLYNVPSLAGFTIDQVVRQILDYCENVVPTPPPSVIVFSGRGLYLKWMWTRPIPKPAAGRFVAVNRALVRRFAPFGADPAACDVSRVLRVIGSINAKSGAAARVVWMSEANGRIVDYDFETFADEVLPFTSEQIRGFRERSAPILQFPRAPRPDRQRTNGRLFCWEDWHWKVLCDIEYLAKARHPSGIVQAGARDTFGFLGACQIAMANVVISRDLWLECQAWARRLLPEDYVAREYRSHTLSLLDRVKRARAGETVAFGSRHPTPVYTFSKARMIDLLKIEPVEMPKLLALIDGDEKQRRRRERGSSIPRSVYEARAQERRQVITDRRAAGETWRTIAADLGISPSEACRLGRSVKAEGRQGFAT